jgi:hypothetical protein
MTRVFRFSVLAASLLIAAAPAAAQAPAATPTATDHQHDFDFEFGAWHAHLRRLVKPLSGSTEWVELDGLSTVRKVWDGDADLGEFSVSNATSHIQGLSLRTFNPATQQWSVYWANRKDGAVTTAPMVGRFDNGRGEFYGDDTFGGKPIRVRFLFTRRTAQAFQLEQSFSADAGKTWEANWIADFTLIGA